MRNSATSMLKAGAAALLLSGLFIAPLAGAAGKVPSPATCKANPSSNTIQGGCLTIDKKKGNCMACHLLAGGHEVGLQMGNIAPPLIEMRKRFNKDRLRQQVWDGTKFNPESTMPPFGRHKILTEEEINKVVEFLLSI